MTDSNDVYDSAGIPESSGSDETPVELTAQQEVDAYFDAQDAEAAEDLLVTDDEFAEFEEVEEEGEDLTEEVEEMPLLEPALNGTENGVKVYDKSGKEVILPADAEIEIKVDGEIVRAKLSDFRNDLSGQKAISQRFSVLDAERKAVAQRKQALDAAESHVGGLMQQGRVVEAMDFVFDAMGYNTQETMIKFFDQIAQPLQKYMSMTPDQQKQWALQAQAERTKLELEKTKNHAAMLQAQQAQLFEVRRVQSELGLDDAKFAQRYHELQRDIEAGAIPPQQITAELVGNYAVLRDRQEWAQEALAKVRPDLAANPNTIDDILRVVIRQYDQAGADFTQEDMRAIVEHAFGTPSKQPKSKAITSALQKKGNPIMKQVPVSPRGQKTQQQKPKGSTNFIDALSKASPKQLNKMIDKWAS